MNQALPFSDQDLVDRACSLKRYLTHSSEAPTKKIETEDMFGKLPSGSLYKLSRASKCPIESIHSVLIYGHGFRPEGIPLTPSLATDTDNPHRAVYNNFLKKGWLMASLSYRREGYILIDAIEDIKELRTLVLETIFDKKPPRKMILQTRSMGGAIATLLNERVEAGLFHGILTLGAALMTRTDPVHGNIPFLHSPRTPQIFLSNVSEKGQVEEYISLVKSAAQLDPTIVLPVLWKVNRFGHCAVFSQELSAALDGLCDWIDGKKAGADTDITDYEYNISSTAWWDSERRGFWVPCSVNMYWEPEFSMSEEDWRKLGIATGATFPIEIHEDIYGLPEDQLPPPRSISVTYGIDPFVGVEEGTLITWVKSVGMKSGLRRHATGTTVSTVAQEFGIRREGFTLFIAEIPVVKKPVRSNKIAHLMKKLEDEVVSD